MSWLTDGSQQQIVQWSPGGDLSQVIAALGTAPDHHAISITGGTGYADMSSSQGEAINALFAEAFLGFGGALLLGGSRMVRNNDLRDIKYGITETGPAIRAVCPQAFLLGIAPRVQHLAYCRSDQYIELVPLIGEDIDRNYKTIIHPQHDMLVYISQRLLPDKSVWDDEVHFRRTISSLLRQYGNWRSLLVAYNGGKTTEQEVRAVAARGWPVLLVRGSGRVTDELINDVVFMREHPSVHICEHSSESMARALARLGAIQHAAPVKTIV
jgi:hypothetical protein